MEKKGNRSVQPASKGLTSEAKKSQDVTNKPWPRGSRRREPSGGTFSKNDVSRKPAPQRSKALDKRPRPRGFYYSSPLGGKEDAGLEAEQEAELGSVFVQGSKKQSLNHLLNFHFEPRESQWHRSSGQANSRSGHRWMSTLKHKYNKEQFLQANCQFIVGESGDYKQYLNNPDALVDWNLVEQVNIHVQEFPSCPICLYPPVAAKMTRCGHIYCWSCVLHYLALSDKTWHKCPICFEAVHKKDLKSVISVPHMTFNTNDEITFKLMKRAKGSLIAYPVDREIVDAGPFKMSDAKAVDVYSKLLLAGKSEIMSIIKRERSELRLQLVEDEDVSEKCFIEEALSVLSVRELCLLSQNESPATVMQDNINNTPQCRSAICRSDSNEVESEDLLESVNSDVLSNDNQNASLTDETIIAENSDLTSSNKEQTFKYFYFYQASDGQHIYLHALNVRMLEHTYGCLEFCPKTVTGRILEKESGSMTEDLRKRLRYLQHLPVICPFEVAEIQLKPPIVPRETIDYFYEQLEIRRKRRQRRSREEKRREKRITEEENRKLGKYAEANIRIESHRQFPEFCPDDKLTIEEKMPQISPRSDRSLSPSSSITSGQADAASVSGSLTIENEFTGPSFAKMLSSNKIPTSIWPIRKSEAAPTVLQNKAEASHSRSYRQSESDGEMEGYIPVPTFNQSFGDAIALALEKAALSNDTEDIKINGKKKKKNKQKKILFATSMGYNGN